MPVLCSRNFATNQTTSTKLPVIQSISRRLNFWDAYASIVRLNVDEVESMSGQN